MKDFNRIKVFVFLTALSAGVLMISNIVAVKLWDFFGIPVDGGIAIFPLTYIIGDLVVELYGKKMANYAVGVGFFINIIATLIFLFVGILPAYSGWENQSAYDAILGFTPRIMIGSLTAYYTSGIVNNIVFEKIRTKTGEKKLWIRTFGSSVVAKLIDSAIFETIAFFGVLSVGEFCLQFIFAYVASLILEFLATPLTYFAVKGLKKYELRG